MEGEKMNKAGLYSQKGFEFQKNVFFLYALQLGVNEFLTYEGLDDVEVTTEYLPIGGIKGTLNNKLIQVKTGNVDIDTLEKIFMNWLLEYDENKEFQCILENDINFDFKDDSYGFTNKLIEKIKSTKKRKSAIIRKVKDKYIDKETVLEDELTFLIKNAKFDTKNIDKLNLEIEAAYTRLYLDDTVPQIINNERREHMISNLRSEIADSILGNISFQINLKKMITLFSNAKDAINDTSYDIPFTDFKTTHQEAINNILKKDNLAVKQLRLVKDEPGFILRYLTEEIFYKDLRNFFISVDKSSEIRNLENLANSHYKEALLEIDIYQQEKSPGNVFLKTIKQKLQSQLFKSNSSNNEFYSNGCYVFLTDDDAPEDYRILWGEIDE